MLVAPAKYAATAITAALALSLLGGCRPKGEARDSAVVAADSGARAPVATAAGAGERNVVTVTASDYAFDAPAEVPAGLTTIRLVNRGPSLHHIQLVKLAAGKTTADLLAALKAGGPPPSWIAFAGGPNPPEPGSTTSATVPLEAGTYAMICFVPDSAGTPHVMKGMARTLTVTAPTAATAAMKSAEPAADVVMTLKDYDFTFSKPLVPGKQTIRVDNAGPQPHEVALIRLNPGKTPEDFAKWAMRPSGAAPGTVHGGLSTVMPGTHAFVEADLPAGDYALICFMPDGKDGKPHYSHGMMKRITIG